MLNFSFHAKFYLHNGKPCREVLFIKQLDSKKSVDLLVVMMNPGSSHPKGVEDYNSIKEDLYNKLVPTEPDTTQDRIINFMEKHQFVHTCVLNLTDVCNQKSEELRATDRLYSQFETVESAQSIIHQHAPDAKHVLIAWGCKAIFRTLIENCKQVISEIDEVQIYGFNQLSDQSNLYYYHPLKRGGDWLNGLRKVNWKRD